MLKRWLLKISPHHVFPILLIVSLAAVVHLSQTNFKLNSHLAAVKTELEILKNQDQLRRNDQLQEEINNINKTYQDALGSYEEILNLRSSKVKTEKLETDFAQILKLLAERNFAQAQTVLADLNKKINKEKKELVASFKILENVVAESNPPAAGYRRQKVQTEFGTFLVDIISADLNNTRVIVDTASESDCTNDCPVLSLAEYVSRNGAFAGVNGSYFCPATYPQCSGKTNSFDTLLMNKNKKYFNSENNLYSTIPAVIFYGNTARFVTQSLEWGRDTGNDDPKQGSRGNRSFVGTTGNTVYLGVVHNVTVAESARVLLTLGIENALNLDNGGSTALWSGGYKIGPGRNLPNVLLLVRK